MERFRQGNAYNAHDEFLVHTAVHTMKSTNVYEGVSVCILYTHCIYIHMYVDVVYCV